MSFDCPRFRTYAIAGCGVFASLAYDDDGYPAIAHACGGSVRFIRKVGGQWQPSEIVASGTASFMRFNPADGTFWISYNASPGSVFVANRASGSWMSELVDTNISQRWIIDLATSPACATPGMSYSTYPNNNLLFADKCGVVP